MPERQSPVMRAATTGERLRDTLRGLFEGAADQPLGQIADALGLADLQGMADQESGDYPPPELKLGMAGRKVPVPQVVAKMGGPGPRTKPNSQSSLDPALKIPRFTSKHGTFLLRNGEWLRLSKQPADSGMLKLERLEKLHEIEGGGTTPRVLEEINISVDDFYKGVLRDKGTVEPGAVAATPRRQPPAASPELTPAPALASPHTYGAGTRLSSAYTMGRDGLPLPPHSAQSGSASAKAWSQGHQEYLASLDATGAPAPRRRK